jgi:hypothetical protein
LWLIEPDVFQIPQLHKHYSVGGYFKMTEFNRTINSLTDKTDELQKQGFCILKAQFDPSLINDCRVAFLPTLKAYLTSNGQLANRGTNRHFLPMPFDKPCFNHEFFFDTDILAILNNVLGDRIVADQWGCDVSLLGSDYQATHVDYQRPLFQELPDLELPAYMLVVSFGLTKITQENGAIEIAAGTHKMPREEGFELVRNSEIKMLPVCLNVGDILIRHPWALHRGTPNKTDTPRTLVTIRYVRSWYYDNSRQVNSIPSSVWSSLTDQQKAMLRFPTQSD